VEKNEEFAKSRSISALGYPRRPPDVCGCRRSQREANQGKFLWGRNSFNQLTPLFLRRGLGGLGSTVLLVNSGRSSGPIWRSDSSSAVQTVLHVLLPGRRLGRLGTLHRGCQILLFLQWTSHFSFESCHCEVPPFLDSSGLSDAAQRGLGLKGCLAPRL